MASKPLCKYKFPVFGNNTDVPCGAFLDHPWHEITSPNFDHGFQERETTMTTKTATTNSATDPTMGVPIAGPAKPKRTPKAAAAGAPVNIATARAASKRRKLTGDEYKNARDFARKTTGYNDTSPIWGKKLNVVLVEIEANLTDGIARYNEGNYADASEAFERALLFNRELQKRVATGQLIAAQS